MARKPAPTAAAVSARSLCFNGISNQVVLSKLGQNWWCWLDVNDWCSCLIMVKKTCSFPLLLSAKKPNTNSLGMLGTGHRSIATIPWVVAENKLPQLLRGSVFTLYGHAHLGSSWQLLLVSSQTTTSSVWKQRAVEFFDRNMQILDPKHLYQSHLKWIFLLERITSGHRRKHFTQKQNRSGSPVHPNINASQVRLKIIINQICFYINFGCLWFLGLTPRSWEAYGQSNVNIKQWIKHVLFCCQHPWVLWTAVN